MIKIGQGIDVHAFHNNGEQQQYVILAGVPIEHNSIACWRTQTAM